MYCSEINCGVATVTGLFVTPGGIAYSYTRPERLLTVEAAILEPFGTNIALAGVSWEASLILHINTSISFCIVSSISTIEVEERPIIGSEKCMKTNGITSASYLFTFIISLSISSANTWL